MAWFFVCRTLFQNLLLDSKDKFAGVVLTKSNNTPAMSRASTFATAVAPLVIFALLSVAQYLKDNL